MKAALFAPVLAAVVVLPLAAAAQGTGEAKSRYHITPSDGGFVRLDTETGTVSHCLNRDGTWVCEPAEEVARTEETVAELMALVEGLTDRLDRLSGQLEVLQAHIDQLNAVAVAAAAAAADPAGEAQPAGEADQPLLPAEAPDQAVGPSLASRLIAPLQQMVGEIKRGIAESSN